MSAAFAPMLSKKLARASGARRVEVGELPNTCESASINAFGLLLMAPGSGVGDDVVPVAIGEVEPLPGADVVLNDVVLKEEESPGRHRL